MANYCVYSGGDGSSGAVAGSVPTATEWSKAYKTLNACLTAVTEAADDNIFMAHDHVGVYTAATTIATTLTTAGQMLNVTSIDRSDDCS